MYDRGIAADEYLPNTDISIEMERKLSPSFVTIPEQGYGTLCTTGIILSDSGLIKFDEQSYNGKEFQLSDIIMNSIDNYY